MPLDAVLRLGQVFFEGQSSVVLKVVLLHDAVPCLSELFPVGVIEEADEGHEAS